MALFGLFGASPYKKFKKTSPEDYNQAQKFQKWTSDVDMDPQNAESGFEISYNTTDEYAESLRQMSEDYIKMIDDDDDGKISYDEFEKFNKDELKDYEGKIDKNDMKECLAGLRRIYDSLDVNKEGDSKDNLDLNEVMNYFYSMDNITSMGKNSYRKSAGYISQYEYKIFGLLLAEDGSQDEVAEKYQKKLKDFINSNYQVVSEDPPEE